MRILAFILFLGISTFFVVTNLTGLWAYHSAVSQPTGEFSGGGSESIDRAAIAQSSSDTPETSYSDDEPASSSGVASGEGSSASAQSDYTVAPYCALWSAEGFNLYYSPVEPSTICVRPSGSPSQAGSPLTPKGASLPGNCAVAPDSIVYCLIGGQLSADTLKAFYDRGELPATKEPEIDQSKKGGLETQAPETTTELTQSTYPPVPAELPDYPALVTAGEPTASSTPTPTPTDEEQYDEYLYWYW